MKKGLQVLQRTAGLLFCPKPNGTGKEKNKMQEWLKELLGEAYTPSWRSR